RKSKTVARALERLRSVFNPTNGSWWIVQTRPTWPIRLLENSTNGSWWIVHSMSNDRPDLNHPPTSVGGI
ncbi:MAG TPA: hypothetical protein VFZ22_04685, partial [Pyrinomonadaceae bacterium]|nr:hypothetical protein [Pyrinomonadaceae bacterium]